MDEIIASNKCLGEWCILHVYRGSIAHGMYIPDTDPLSIDDKDTMAICVPDISHYFGLRQFGSRGTREIKKMEWDIVIYEAKKALSLLKQGNPNVLSLLWTDEIIKTTIAGNLLRSNRDLFAGKHVYDSFVGYAHAQLSKMQKYAHEGYMGAKRKLLVERFGYDPKNAAHLIRLLRMGSEFLKTGELIVKRPDADELLSIKRGEWELEDVKDVADKLFLSIEIAKDQSPLPEKPDVDAIDALCIEIVNEALKE